MQFIDGRPLTDVLCELKNPTTPTGNDEAALLRLWREKRGERPLVTMILKLEAEAVATLMRETMADASAVGSIRPRLLTFAERHGIPV